MKERLLKIASFYGISVRKFEEECELKRGNISNMSNNSSIGSDKLTKIIDRYPLVSLDWLVSGKGEMLKRSVSEECETTPNHPLLEDEDTNKIAILQTQSPNEGIPLIPAEAMAGALSGEVSILEYECERYVIPVFKGADFLIPVKGSSMYPKYGSGDIVACKRIPMSDLFFQWNKVYVIDTNQGALIKRIKKGSDNEHVLIVSDNENYDPFELPYSAIYSVALVIGVIRLE